MPGIAPASTVPDAVTQASTPLELAEQALALANSRPQEAREVALAVLRSVPSPPGAAVAAAELALGRVANLVEDLAAARAHLNRSIRHARLAGDSRGEAEARLSRSYTFAQEGRFRAAFAELDLIEPAMSLDDGGMGRVHTQRAAVCWLRGADEQALPHFGLAAERSARAGDELNLLRVLINRGVLHGRLGGYAAAQRDLVRAEQLAARLDMPMMVAIAQQDLGWVAAQRGDVPTALARYDQAEHAYRPHCEELGSLLLDRCEVLLGARLLAEAADAAQRALAAFEEGGAALSVPEAQLYLAETALLAAEPAAAREHADAALRSFRRQRRPGWAALARYAALRAGLLDADGDAAGARAEALRVASALTDNGLHERALDVRIVAAQLGLQCGATAAAKRELGAASAARTRGTVERRTRAWHAEALLRLASGERSGARSALRAGLRILEQHRAMLGATDLRAAASVHRVDIARLGFELAVTDGRPREALEWVERSRAGLTRLRAVRPPNDETLATALTQLRATLRDIDDAVRAGERVGALRARQASLERAIRDHCRGLPPAAISYPAAPPNLRQLAGRLGPRVLLEFVELRAELFVIVFAAGRASVRRIGPAPEVENAVRRLVMLLDRAARSHGDHARQRQNTARLLDQAAALDHLVAAPLADVLAGDPAPVVVAPASAVRAVPWFALPSFRGRTVSIAPSATAWFEAADPAVAGPGHVALAAGPGLPHAEGEVLALAEEYPAARVLVGGQATVAATLAMLDGASLAHVAAHGTFRADSPLFSALSMADGPLTIYDLEGMAAAPHTVVLAACESARHSSHPGDDLLGLASAFLSLGSRVLIAPLVSLPDGQSAELMAELHARMHAGASPAVALAATQLASASDGDGSAFAAAAGFVCFGAG